MFFYNFAHRISDRYDKEWNHMNKYIMKKRKVFISYSRHNYIDENENIIQGSSLLKIIQKLDEQGIDRWIDVEGKYAGHSFGPEIRTAIIECDLLIFISSFESNQSVWTPSELYTAKKNHKLIIPVLIDNTEFAENIEFYIPGHIDCIEFYKNEQYGLEKIINNINKEFHRLDEIDRKKREEEERIAKEKEEKERQEREEAEKRARLAAEKEKEKQRKEALTKEIHQIKIRIKGRIDKDKEDLPRLASLEKELDSTYELDNLCPVCGVAKEDKDFCENCGWFFRTAAERLITQKRNHYIERLDYSTKIWKQKEEQDESLNRLRLLEIELTQNNQLVETLASECELLKKAKQTNEEELTKSKSRIVELQKRIDKLTAENQKTAEKIQNELKVKSKLEQELKKNEKENLKKTQQFETTITELQNKLSKQKSDDELNEKAISAKVSQNNIAYLLAEEYGQYGIYCLCEGVNTFGSIVRQRNSGENYQMIVAACPELQPKHFSLDIKKEDKKVTIMLDPYSSDCLVCLNNKNQKIKVSTSININDVIYIGELKLYIIDNFNK